MSLKSHDNEDGKINPDEGIYVEMVGVMEVRLVDAEGNIDETQDFMEFQDKMPRIPKDFCHKDVDGNQAIFFCLVCDCEVKSIVSLIAHVKGNKHIRKALAYKQKTLGIEKAPVNQPKQKKIAGPKARIEISRSLEQRLRGYAGPILGLSHIVEFTNPRDRRDPPFYTCRLNNCKSAWGNSDDMFNHVKGHKHIRNYFKNLWPDDHRVDQLNKNELFNRAKKRAEDLSNELPESRDYHTINLVDDIEQYRSISTRPKDWSEKKERLQMMGHGGRGGGGDRRGGGGRDGNRCNGANLEPIGYKKRGLFNEERWKDYTVPTPQQVFDNSAKSWQTTLAALRQDVSSGKDLKSVLNMIDINLDLIEVDKEIAMEVDGVDNIAGYRDKLDDLRRELMDLRRDAADLRQQRLAQQAQMARSQEAVSVPIPASVPSVPASVPVPAPVPVPPSVPEESERDKYIGIFKQGVKKVVLAVANERLRGKSSTDIEDISEMITESKILPAEIKNFEKKNKFEWSDFKLTDKTKIRLEKFILTYLNKKYPMM